MGNSKKPKKPNNINKTGKAAPHWNGAMVGTGSEPIDNSAEINATPETTQEVVSEFVNKLIKLRQDRPELMPSPEEQEAAAERLQRTMAALARASETVREHLDRIGAAYSINETANILVIDLNKLAVIENENNNG